MSRHNSDMDDFMEFALYMLPRYMRRIERYRRRHVKEEIFDDHEKKKRDYFPDEFIDKKLLLDIIKKNFLDEKFALPGDKKRDIKKDLTKKHDKKDDIDIPIFKKGMEKADKIIDKTIDNAMDKNNHKSKENGRTDETPDKHDEKKVSNNVPQDNNKDKKENKNTMHTSSTRIKVRYAETDKMGIAHHSNYYIWFEEARGDFIKEANITYRDMEEKGIMMPLVETYCKYSKAAKYDDNLIIETSISEFNPVKISFDYRVLNEKNGELLAKGKTTQTFINTKFKIINLQRRYPELWEKLQSLR